MQDILDRLERNYERQRKALLTTIDEIEQIEKIVPTPKALLRALKQKRERQDRLASESAHNIQVLKTQMEQLQLLQEEKDIGPQLGKTRRQR